MKRICVIATLLVFLSATFAPMQVYASDIEFSIGGANVPIARGTTVTFPIVVRGNPGFTFVGLVVNYNPNVFQVTGVTAPVAAMPLNQQFQLSTTPGTQWVSLISANLSDWTGNGTVAYITFNVRADAPLGPSALTLGFTSSPDGTPVNAVGEVLGEVTGTATTSGGSVSVYPSVPVATPTPSPSPSPSPTPTPGQGGGTGNSNIQYAPYAPGDAIYADSPPGDGPDNPNDSDNSDDTDDSDDPSDATVGDFIGNPFIPDDDFGDYFLNETDNPDTGNTSNTDFGSVPQTGIPGVFGMAVIMFLGIVTTAAMWTYVYRRRHGSVGNG